MTAVPTLEELRLGRLLPSPVVKETMKASVDVRSPAAAVKKRGSTVLDPVLHAIHRKAAIWCVRVNCGIDEDRIDGAAFLYFLDDFDESTVVVTYKGVHGDSRFGVGHQKHCVPEKKQRLL